MSKEKQIEEMAKVIHDLDKNYKNILPSSLANCVYNHGGTRTAEAVALYEAGYRKQSEGEWVAKKPMIRSPYARNYYCSACKHEPIEVKSFCPNCGARMKGDCEHREWFGDMALHYCKKDREICEDVSKCTKGGEG